VSAETDPLLAPIPDGERMEVGGCVVDVVHIGEGQVKRSVYPPGFRWSKDMGPEVGTDRCRFAHVGFLARGGVAGEYADGCTFEFRAPAAVIIEPGHDAWVVGDEPAVLIEVDFERETTSRFGLRAEHGHD
jgi:hypothetical protein